MPDWTHAPLCAATAYFFFGSQSAIQRGGTNYTDFGTAGRESCPIPSLAAPLNFYMSIKSYQAHLAVPRALREVIQSRALLHWRTVAMPDLEAERVHALQSDCCHEADSLHY